MQRIVAGVAELERAEQDAKQTFDAIEHQLSDLEQFLAPLHKQWTGSAAQAWADYQRRWDAAAADLQASLTELHRIMGTSRGNYHAAVAANLRMWGR